MLISVKSELPTSLFKVYEFIRPDKDEIDATIKEALEDRREKNIILHSNIDVITMLNLQVLEE